MTLADHAVVVPPDGTPATRRVRFDAVTFLTVYLVLLLGIPSYLVIPALGTMGQLSLLWGLAGLAWWAFTAVSRGGRGHRRTSPVGVALAVLLAVVATAYGMGALHGLPTHLAAAADSGLIRVLSWSGVALVALDGIRTRARLLALVRRVAWAGALMSVLGLAQFVTGQPLVTSISLPGFAVDGSFAGVMDRGGFVRAAGTASHPLEYGTLLCLTLPLALALGMSELRRPWFVRWLPAGLIALAVALSVSRSTLIGVAFGLLVLAPRVPPAYRLRGALLGVLLGAAMLVAVPGLVGTMLGLFTAIGSDASTVSRTGSSDVVLEIVGRHWWLGHGYGTFQPNELILDNQFLLILVELGVLGLAAFAAVVLTSIACAWRSAPRPRVAGPGGAPAPAVSHSLATGPALAAGIAAGSLTLAFFDGLSFPISAGLLFLSYGAAGASWRIARTDRSAADG
ncbi:O-antigen ligase family protein [Georgenia sp. Z1344]|uniref:O-antigen ligase family protein n=1 Tax=Georgenia sp. Z1344 TaxID=3416706 RepID=UPI003CEA6417